MLSKDPELGQRLFDEEVGVPIATQVRYYLEYMTDQLEPYIERVQVPVLSLEIPAAQVMSLDNLPQSMKDQLVKRYGSLEKAREQVRVSGTTWQAVAARAPSGIVRSQQIADSGAFMMQDVPEVFDRALADFTADLEPPPKKNSR